MEGNASENQQPIFHPVVDELCEWVAASPDRKTHFDQAIITATNQNIVEMQDIRCLSDWFNYLTSLQLWVPCDSVNATEIFDRLSKMYFVLSQPSILSYQSPVTPGSSSKELSFVSRWMTRFSIAFGTFMDTPESLTADTLATFKASPKYRLHEYAPPRGGWRTFNELFARQYKPGYLPIASIEDSSIIVSPGDITFCEHLSISALSTIDAKGITWSISELLAESIFKDRFKNGTWMHGYLAPNDYHRIHTPVGGKVVEARCISGQHYVLIETMELETEDSNDDQKKTLTKRRVLHPPNNTGYQFVQSRGLVVLDTDIGLVAILPVGMAIVSSVILTAEEGVTLRKGEELGYFQFGGSDIVVIFEAKVKVRLDAEVGVHYKTGVQIGSARVT